MNSIVNRRRDLVQTPGQGGRPRQRWSELARSLAERKATRQSSHGPLIF